MRVITWLLRAFLFFVLFAFAMNNQHEARLKWFFGYEWRAPMVVVVLAVFAFGCILGLLGQVPGWWRRLRAGRTPTSPTHLNLPASSRSPAAGSAAAGATASAIGAEAGGDGGSAGRRGSRISGGSGEGKMGSSLATGNRTSGFATARSPGAAGLVSEGPDTLIEPPRDGL